MNGGWKLGEKKGNCAYAALIYRHFLRKQVFQVFFKTAFLASQGPFFLQNTFLMKPAAAPHLGFMQKQTRRPPG
jgi:hypothetical protein